MKNKIKEILPESIVKILGDIKAHLIVFKCNVILFIISLNKPKYKILDDSEAVEKIINEKLSLARYGDGEFKWMLDIPQTSFQESNAELTRRLNEIINTDYEKIIIGIPVALNSVKEYTFEAKLYWQQFLKANIKLIHKVLNANTIYANTNITRPYIDYKNKSQCKSKFTNLKKIWENKEIVIIEGEKSKLGMGNDLFDNAIKVERIICPSKNAFSKYDEILKESLKIDKNKLILISLGPTATVLAYDLAKNGHQALDIGHIDIEYEWFIHNAKTKTEVSGKYVNEAKNKNVSDVYDNDEKYLNSIIAKIL